MLSTTCSWLYWCSNATSTCAYEYIYSCGIVQEIYIKGISQTFNLLAKMQSR